jgi:hypothetical protein
MLFILRIIQNINTPFWQNISVLNVKTAGMKNNHCNLKSEFKTVVVIWYSTVSLMQSFYLVLMLSVEGILKNSYTG